MTLRRSKTSLLYIKVHFIIDKEQLKHILNSYSSNHHSTHPDSHNSQRLYSSHRQHTVLIYSVSTVLWDEVNLRNASIGYKKLPLMVKDEARPVTQRHQRRVRFQSFPLVKSQGPSLRHQKRVTEFGPFLWQVSPCPVCDQNKSPHHYYDTGWAVAIIDHTPR